MPTAPHVDAPQHSAFEVEHFDFVGDDRLEVSGRWFGVRGRRFVRPVLIIDVAGERRRLVALLDHKPWHAADGEPWVAAFSWEGPREAAGTAELEVGSLTVELPEPGGSSGVTDVVNRPSAPPRARRPGGSGRPAAAAEAVELGPGARARRAQGA